TGELLIGRIGLSPRRARFSHLILVLVPMVSLLIHCSCGVGRVVTRVTSEVVQPEFGAPRTCRLPPPRNDHRSPSSASATSVFRPQPSWPVPERRWSGSTS